MFKLAVKEYLQNLNTDNIRSLEQQLLLPYRNDGFDDEREEINQHIKAAVFELYG